MNKIIILLSLSLIFAACSHSGQDIDASGMFEATEVIVSAEGNGKLLSLDILEGSKVENAQILGLIDTTQLYLSKVQLMQSKAQVSTRKQDIPTQMAAIEEQLAYQKREKERFQQLLNANAGNQKQIDDINAQIFILERQFEAQKEQLQKGNAGIYEQLNVVDAQIASLDDQLKRCRIASPIHGTILAKYAEAGEFVSMGKPLFKVAKLDEIFLRAYINASQMSQIQLGQKVSVLSDFEDGGTREYEGTICWLADEAEFTPKTIQTKDERANLVYAIKIAVKNDGFLKIGMYGDVKF